ncbi:MAG: TlpA family protein disulfide reductase [Nitrosomonadales bacterium]|nr:TlpA family protein disulfide reductase [Nitrosomonadales bacterium]
MAAGLNDIEAIPHLDKAGKEGYREFLTAEKHRAFAIAPGGAWTWNGGGSSAESVAEDTQQTCEFDNGQTCMIYALDDRVVFDSQTWAGLWGPYLDRTQASRAAVGLKRGERFYDLSFRSADGHPMQLSDLQGKVVVLHFWGSWCLPCRREMPEMQQLHRALGRSSDIQMVMLQVREDFATARKWTRQQHLKLPLYDSGVSKKANDTLNLAAGKTIHDRYIAEMFPTTYILDKHGIVVFSNIGPISRWSEYLPLLRDVAARSGK